MTVVAALSSLLILAYFTISPMLSSESTAGRVETGLGGAIDKFESMKNEQRFGSNLTVKPNT